MLEGILLIQKSCGGRIFSQVHDLTLLGDRLGVHDLTEPGDGLGVHDPTALVDGLGV